VAITEIRSQYFADLFFIGGNHPLNTPNSLKANLKRGIGF
jgi:hypothetical protein